MATATKTLRELQASASNAAGATATGTTIDLRTAFGMFVVGRITNGGTGPTVGCDFVVQASTDDSDWYEIFRATAGTANSLVTEIPFTIGKDVMYARSVFTGNTGQAVTVECQGHETTSIA